MARPMAQTQSGRLSQKPGGGRWPRAVVGRRTCSLSPNDLSTRSLQTLVDGETSNHNRPFGPPSKVPKQRPHVMYGRPKQTPAYRIFIDAKTKVFLSDCQICNVPG
jgi:hypothetical protein